MWDFIIYLKCCKYDGCRVASRYCSRLVLRCESDSDLDSQGKTVERCILCKLSPGISELSGIAWKHGGCRKNSECYFLNLSNIWQPGAENPPDITRFRNRGRVTDRWNPGSMAGRCSVWFWKIEIYGKMFPFSLFFLSLLSFSSYYHSFSFFSPSRSWDHQFSGGWRKS